MVKEPRDVYIVEEVKYVYIKTANRFVRNVMEILYVLIIK